ncbi:MAG: peptide-methionine (S)-S-oxide reductase MsrA [Thermoplasmata archaeon]
MIEDAKSDREVVTLGGGCFWCLQPVFQELHGVERVEVGYSGGRVANPSYEAVCTDTTGHAEVFQATFNSNVVSFEDLLKVFFSVHDPTTLNRQGNDVGTQYRSAIFFHTLEQKATAERVIKEIAAEELWENPVVTEVTAFKAFYPAEEYHQGYFEKNPWAGYCRAIIAPKVSKFRKAWREKLKK